LCEWFVRADDDSDAELDDENSVLIGCVRGDIVGLQYYKGMVSTVVDCYRNINTNYMVQNINTYRPHFNRRVIKCLSYFKQKLKQQYC